MTERPPDGAGDRRRTGPLGDDEETRQEPPASSDESTRQIPTQQPAGRTDGASEDAGGERRTSRNLRRRSRSGEGDTAAGDGETRVIRPPGNTAGNAAAGDTREDSYPGGYFEAAEEREERLRDIYGGVDWLASFLGFVFVFVAGAVFTAIAILVLAPLGFSLNIGPTGGVAEITTLVVLAVLIFFAYLFGGYVAGRLARFDGGRNGAMSVVWGVVVGALLLALFGILPGALFEAVRNFLSRSVTPVFVNLLDAGLVGLAVVLGAVLVALLGGIFGGRLGGRYHAEIDRTT